MNNRMIKSISHKKMGALAGGVISAFVMTFSIVAGTSMISNLIDQLIEQNHVNIGSNWPIIALLIVTGTVSAYFKSCFIGRYSAGISEAFNEVAIDKLTRLNYQFYEKEGSGKIMTKMISDIGELEKYYSSTLPDLIISIITVGVVMIYVGSNSLILMIVAMISYPIVLAITFFLGKILKRLAQNRRGKIDVMVSQVSDSIDGIQVVRSYNLYNVITERIKQTIQSILDNEYKRAWIMHFSQTLQRFLFWIPNMLCPVIAMIMVLRGNISVGTMMAYIVLMNKIMGSMREIPFLINDAKEKSASIDRLEAVLQEPDELIGDYNGRDIQSIIKFKNVSFKYDTRGEQVLKEVSFDIQKGSTVAVVGPSGQGKTTIFKILCGFYSPQSGQYVIDGHDIREWDINALRDKIAVVSQTPFLFEGTIADNIAAGVGNASMEQIVYAAKQAGIHELVMSLEEQYETNVGENGVKLSGGERQRISIARAFIKDAPVILMDEPTSSVDVETENIIKTAINNLPENKTVIIIAHRLTTIQGADNILVINNGRVVESGTHYQLMEEKSVYWELYKGEMEEPAQNSFRMEGK